MSNNLPSNAVKIPLQLYTIQHNRLLTFCCSLLSGVQSRKRGIMQCFGSSKTLVSVSCDTEFGAVVSYYWVSDRFSVSSKQRILRTDVRLQSLHRPFRLLTGHSGFFIFVDFYGSNMDISNQYSHIWSVKYVKIKNPECPVLIMPPSICDLELFIG